MSAALVVCKWTLIHDEDDDDDDDLVTPLAATVADCNTIIFFC